MSSEPRTVKGLRSTVEVYLCSYHQIHNALPARFSRTCKPLDPHESCSVLECNQPVSGSWYHTILITFAFGLDD